MRIASTITTTTAKVIVSIKDESGCIILEKVFKLAIPEKVSGQMADMRVETVIDKQEYQLASTVKKTLAPDGTVINTDYIEHTS